MKNTFYFLVILLLFAISTFSSAQPHWQRLADPCNFSSTALALGSPGEIFTAYKNSGLFMSSDNGSSWSRITPDSMSKDNIPYIVKDNNGNLFFTNNPGWNQSSVFMSNDNGQIWKSIPIPGYSLLGNVASDSKGNIYTGYSSLIYSYNIDSLDWIKLSTPLNSYMTQIFVNDSDEVVALTNYGLFFSKNYGITWTNQQASFSELRYYKGRGFYGRNMDTIFFSADGCHSWSRFATIGYYPENVNKWEVDGNDNVYLLHRNGRMLYTSDRGANWQELDNVNRRNKVNDIRVDYRNIFMCATDWEGLRYTGNQGQAWGTFDITTSLVTLAAIGVGKNDTLFAASRDSSIFMSENGGLSWKKIFSSLPSNPLYITSNSVGDVFIGCEASLFRCFAGSKIFMPANMGLDYGANALAFVDTTLIFAATSGGIYQSNDNGNSWIKNYFLDEDQVSPRFLSVAVHGNKVFAGSADSGLFVADIDNVYFTRTHISPDDTLIEIRSIIPYNNKIYLGTNHGIYTSSDEGTNWQKLSSALADDDIKIMKLTPNGRFFIVCGNNRIYYSADSCLSWIESTDGLAGDTIVSLEFDSRGYFYAATKDSGVYKTDIPLKVEEQPASTGTEIKISPNPSVSLVSIEFDTRMASNISVRIYDMTGNLLGNLLNGYFGPQHHNIKWNSAPYPSGTYLAEVIINGVTTSALINVVK